MQDKEQYSDRRRIEKKHDSRGCNPKSDNPRKSDPRRSDIRLNRSYKISAHDYDGKTVNVSAKGVYFKVATKDKGVFPVGTSHSLLINAVTNTPEDRERKYRLRGRGTVVRNCIIANQDHTDSLGVAFKFTEKLHTELDNS